MCGIVGALGAIGINEEKAFKLMLQLDTVRGPDSTGVFGVSTLGAQRTIKAVGTPWELMETKSFDKFFAGAYNLLIGHNRWATVGGVTKATAHPFTIDDVTGVHNGTLKNWERKLDDSYDFDVDSECLYHNIAKNGLVETLDKLGYGDAYALVYYDAETNKVNFIRNTERPLWFAYTKDGRTLFWASEAWMITVAAAKSNVKLQPAFQLETNTLVSIDVVRSNAYNAKPIPASEITEEVVKRKVVVLPKKKQPEAGASTTRTSTNSGNSGTSVTKLPDRVIGEEVVFRITNPVMQKETRFSKIYFECTSESGVKLRWFPACQEEDHPFIVESLKGKVTYRARVTAKVFGTDDEYVVNPDTVTRVKEKEVKK